MVRMVDGKIVGENRAGGRIDGMNIAAAPAVLRHARLEHHPVVVYENRLSLFGEFDRSGTDIAKRKRAPREQRERHEHAN
jgi:hypothetical protein